MTNQRHRAADQDIQAKRPNRSTAKELSSLNAVCPYYTMFPLDFPLGVLGNARAGDWVADPFCGRGSTNFAARLLGLPSIGVDSNPVAVAIARAKLISTTPGRIVQACRHILTQSALPRSVPQGEFWRLCYHPDTLTDLCLLREALLSDCSSAARQGLMAFILGRLHGPLTKSAPPSYLSNQMPRTYASKPDYAVSYWRRHHFVAPRVDILDLVTRKAPAYFASLPTRTAGRIECVDSRSCDFEELLLRANKAKWPPVIHWVITSPPYYGMRTYVQDQWLRYWFVGGPSEVSYQTNCQLTHGSSELFAGDLADVWKKVSSACAVGARLIVRFGGIPERSVRPRDILYRSLELANCGWRVMTAKSAGEPRAHRRQASQFIEEPARPIEEFDVFARLT